MSCIKTKDSSPRFQQNNLIRSLAARCTTGIDELVIRIMPSCPGIYTCLGFGQVWGVQAVRKKISLLHGKNFPFWKKISINISDIQTSYSFPRITSHF